jgi:hypothetical protein
MSEVRTPNSGKLYLLKTDLQDIIKSDKIVSSV